MSVICPCITATNPAEYQKQLAAVQDFSTRVHIDIADGSMAPGRLISPNNLQWPQQLRADVHVMYQDPLPVLETLIALQPHTIILHAESVNIAEALAGLVGFGSHIGLAVLPTTEVALIAAWLPKLDHVLLFSGDLGKFGGVADLTLLRKIDQLHAIKPELEIGWDGGINASNIAQLVEAGISVCNVGGYIQNSGTPKQAYEELQAQIQS